MAYTQRTSSRLGSYERQRFGGMGARPPMRRSFSGFGGIEAANTAKESFSRNIDTSESNFDSLSKEMVYVELTKLKEELGKYNSWSSKWMGSWGSAEWWYSSDDILAKINALLSRVPAGAAQGSGVQAAIKRAYIPISATPQEEKKEEEKEEESFWVGLTGIFQSALPTAGELWKQQQAIKQQQDLIKLAQRNSGVSQPQQIVIEQGGGGSKTGLIVGLGVAGLAAVVGIMMLRG